MTNQDLEVRRRRALWRAQHRGTKELDLLIGSYASAQLAAMDETELARFEAFLLLEETDLQAWLLAPVAPEGVPFADVVEAVRAHHGMGAAL